MTATILFLSALVAIAGLALLIWNAGRKSITGIKSRNRYYGRLSRQLQFSTTGDDYFLQLEGSWKGTQVVIYPHNFEGPGAITVFFADTGVPCRERTWIEPILSPGRALVDWKRGVRFQLEVTGEPVLPREIITNAIQELLSKYPYVAVTVPTRFLFSPVLMQTVGSWKNFVVLLILDAGRKPRLPSVRDALDATVHLAEIVQSYSAR